MPLLLEPGNPIDPSKEAPRVQVTGIVVNGQLQYGARTYYNEHIKDAPLAQPPTYKDVAKELKAMKPDHIVASSVFASKSPRPFGENPSTFDD